ncbi:hypothetical protein [Microbulbifer sp. DLAB2-AA]|uniref:hypothetical protein n=1 Tax=Microbulbifer sp. DLAB2-AA TaxID=3243394 RepID=UPI00403A6AD2
MKHVEVNLTEQGYLNGIEELRSVILDARKKIKESSAQSEGFLNVGSASRYVAARVSYGGDAAIDFYIEPVSVYVVGFDPKAYVSTGGMRYFLSDRLPGVAQGKDTDSMKMESAFLEEVLNKQSVDRALYKVQTIAIWDKDDKRGVGGDGLPQVAGITFSKKKSVVDLRHNGTYNDLNLTGNRGDVIDSEKIAGVFNHLCNIDGKYGDGKNDSYCIPLGVMVLLLSEAVRFESVCKFFNELVAYRSGEDFFENVGQILDKVQNWKSSGKDADIAVPCEGVSG